MTYLSYQWQNGQPTAVASNTIDAHSTFTQTGTCLALAGINIGFNVLVFGAPIPGGMVNFQRIPMFQTGWDAQPPGDTGIVIPQANGTCAIQWPL